MLIKNIKDFGVSKGILREAAQSLDYFLPVFKTFLNHFKLPFFDDCCNEIGEAGLPVGYKNNVLQYYNNITKQYIAVPIPIPPIVPPVPLLMFENNAAAIAGGLTQGQQYYLPYNNGSYVVAVVILPALEITMVTNRTSSKEITLALNADIPTDITIDWGDGSAIQTLSNEYLNITLSHTYPDSSAYTAKIRFSNNDNVLRIQASNQEVIAIQNLNLFTKIERILLYGNNLTTIPAFVNNINLVDIDFQQNNITQESLNDTLIYLDNTFIQVFGFNSQSQTPSTPPSGAGEVARNSLVMKGCDIYLDQL